MAGQGTLIATTRSGVRPLGVRGEPLHNGASQIRRVIRRRLGDGPADLLADPVPHEDGSAIGWYASWTGAVRPLAALDAEERLSAIRAVDLGLAGIDRLGETLAGAGDPENTGLIARTLHMAARRPADSFIYMVGDRPVVVAWGYEIETAPTVIPTAVAPAPPPAPAPTPPAPTLASTPASTLASTQHVSVLKPRPGLPVAVLRPITGSIPWARTLAIALPLLLLLLASTYLLRGCLPDDPSLHIATEESRVAPPPAPARAPDPLPVLKASLSTEQAREQALKREMAVIDAELKKRIADCKPPGAPKPPQVAVAPPPVPTPPPPQATPKPTPAPTPPPPPQRPADDKLRIPAPGNNYSFLQGCWRTDPFQHERGYAPGVSTYCFDGNGNGQLEWRRGRTACRTRAQARFEGSTLRLRDNDSNCNDGSHWYADSLVCQRGADNVAQCSGRSQGGTFGPTSWTVNLHKLN